jgi:hypothetical protein
VYGGARLDLRFVELLAVIANINRLAVMLLPALTTTKEGDHRTVGPTDFGRLGLALMMFTDCSENQILR